MARKSAKEINGFRRDGNPPRRHPALPPWKWNGRKRTAKLRRSTLQFTFIYAISIRHEQFTRQDRDGAHIRACRRPSFADWNAEAPASRAGPTWTTFPVPGLGPASPRKARSRDRVQPGAGGGDASAIDGRGHRGAGDAGLVRGAPDPTTDGRPSCRSRRLAANGCAPAGPRGRTGCRAPSGAAVSARAAGTWPRGRAAQAARRRLTRLAARSPKAFS